MELSLDKKKEVLAVFGTCRTHTNTGSFCGCCGASKNLNFTRPASSNAFVATMFLGHDLDTDVAPRGRDFLVVPDKELNLLIDWPAS